MGSSIALILAATYPDLINKLIIIEGLGPITKRKRRCRFRAGNV